MSHLLLAPILLLTTLASDAVTSPLHQAGASEPLVATGTFLQTSITSLEVQSAGGTTILTQTSAGSVTGTLTGTFTDSLRVVVQPNGSFVASFTLLCDCAVAGRTGVLTLQATDVGEMVSPTLGRFEGLAVITGGTGGLSGLRGVLAIEGTVDLTSGLSTYSYSGQVLWTR